MGELEKLIQELKDPNPVKRWGAPYLLGYHEDIRAVRALIEALNDEFSKVRWHVVDALICIAESSQKIEVDLVKVRASLKEFVKKQKDPEEREKAKQWAAEAYAKIAKAVSERKKKEMPGEMLPPNFKPRKKLGIYREMRRAVV